MNSCRPDLVSSSSCVFLVSRVRLLSENLPTRGIGPLMSASGRAPESAQGPLYRKEAERAAQHARALAGTKEDLCGRGCVSAARGCDTAQLEMGSSEFMSKANYEVSCLKWSPRMLLMLRGFLVASRKNRSKEQFSGKKNQKRRTAPVLTLVLSAWAHKKGQRNASFRARRHVLPEQLRDIF